MMKNTDIFNDESLQNDIQDLVAIEQGLLRANCPLPDLDAELEKIIGKENVTPAKDASGEALVEKHRSVMFRSLASALFGAAAMLALVFAWQWLKTNGVEGNTNPLAMNASEEVSEQSAEAVIQTAEGEMITLTLADGTVVKLNGNSKLSYPHRFQKGKERMVYLEGEAFFSVKHDSKSSFIVDAGGVLTKDLGTIFNVKAYSTHDCKVTLVEGSVAVLAKGDKAKPIILTPGQQYSISSSETEQPIINNVDTDETTAWADGVYYYHDQTLEHIVTNLASRYRVNTDFRNQQVKGVHLDFSADRNGSLTDAVQLLNDLGIAKVSVNGSRIVVE